jgi:4-hydroxythreonine-4-phosphate dehydrogenase
MKPIAITMGDAAGIGPEIIALAFRDAPEALRGAFVAGDVAALRRAAQIVQGNAGVPLPVAQIDQPADALNAPPRCVPVLQAVAPAAALPPLGQISAEAGRMAGEAVVWAARAALRGEVAALVTAPLNKAALAAAGKPYDRFPGHTELLQEQAAAHRGVPPAQAPVRMMLANDELRVVLVSIHVSLREAIERVTAENVLQTLRIAHAALARPLGRPPRLAVAGLNPHAGEGGLFGREEIEHIAPAIEQATRQGINARGPFPPDTVFMRARRGEFDAVIAMTHDHGLIPVKYLGVEQGVNVTLGLPFVRTSPDHGAAFDLAGTARATPASLLAALRMARQASQRESG